MHAAYVTARLGFLRDSAIAELISVCVQGKQAFWQDIFEAAIRRRQRRWALPQP